MCQSCEVCQQLGPIFRSGKGPLQFIMAFEPFMKQGLNFMGLMKPTLIIDIYYGY